MAATRNGTPKSGSGTNVEAPLPQHYRRKVALIAGITGQDGSYLTEFLLDKGYEVHGLIHRSSNFNTGRVNPIDVDTHKARTMKLHYADLTDSSSLRRCMDTISPDEVYNLAAQTDVAVPLPADVDATITVAFGLLEAVRSHVSATGRGHTRYCQAGSSGMFGTKSDEPGEWRPGRGRDPLPLSETSPFHPRSPYSAAQCAAYWITMRYREVHGLFACNAILFNHESPRQGESFVTRKITRAVGRIKMGLQSELLLADLENLDDYRDWGFAGDYVEAMWMMLQQEKPDDYVVATGESHTVEDFLNEALKCVGLHWKDHVMIEGHVILAEVDYLKGDASKVRKVAGWKPKVGFEELVKMMVDEDVELAKFEKLQVDPQQQP